MALSPYFFNPYGLRSQYVLPLVADGSGDQSATGSAGAATTVTVTGDPGRKVIIRQLGWSYSGAPTGGSIKIEDSAGSPVTYFDLHVTAAGPDGWVFTPPLSLPAGLSATITLAAPGGAVVGKLFVNAYIEK